MKRFARRKKILPQFHIPPLRGWKEYCCWRQHRWFWCWECSWERSWRIWIWPESPQLEAFHYKNSTNSPEKWRAIFVPDLHLWYDFQKLWPETENRMRKKIVKWQKSRYERCDITKKKSMSLLYSVEVANFDKCWMA